MSNKLNIKNNSALLDFLEKNLGNIAKEEDLSVEFIKESIENGTMVLLANPNHKNIKPLLIGQPSRVKINANIGTSPLTNNLELELKKLCVAINTGADTIMDLSIAGDLDTIRISMLKKCNIPVGTVPMYALGKKLLENDRDIASMHEDELFAEIEKQAKQGVDFVTLHCGLSRKGAELAINDRRKLGIVSRGGSMLARWMLENDRENPLLEHFDRLLEICLPYNMTISLGDGLRPGAGIDSGDAAQFEEVLQLGQCVLKAKQYGVQTMVEGPGHVPLNQVKSQIQTIKGMTYNAPLYVLGPLCCDSAAGYDHIAGAIGGALGVEAGVDFLCYLTPAEHLTLPNEKDVRDGVMASKIAAHVGEIALSRKRALDREKGMNKARKALDWNEMKKYALDPESIKRRELDKNDEETCAMCGKFCSVKMLDLQCTKCSN